MRAELSEVSPVKKRLKVEVAAEDVSVVLDKLVREQRKQVNIPGFRPGKAPLDMIRGRLGGALHREAADKILEFYSSKAIHEQGLHPIPNGVYVEFEEGAERELPPVAEGEPYSFTIAVEVMPEFEVADYAGLEVEKPSAEVGEEEIDAQLEELRDSRARVVPVEGRPSQTGDLLGVEIEGKEVEGDYAIEREERTIRLGAEGNLPEFERGLIGLEEGKSFSFDVDYPEEYPAEELQGKTMTFRGVLKKIQATEKPELTDELAKEVAGVDTVDELRERVRGYLQSTKEREADQKVRRAILDQLLEKHEFEVPQALVDAETRARLDDLGRRLASQGVDPEKLDIDWKQVVEREEKEAARSVRESLILEKIANKEALLVTKAELDQAVEVMARDSQTEPAKIRQAMKRGGTLQGFEKHILRSKCLDWLKDKAHIA